MKRKVLYILTTAILSISAFFVGQTTNGKNNVNLNTVIDYVQTADGIILHTADRTGNIDGYILDIPQGIWNWNSYRRIAEK